jgi:hypothetical protein
MPGQISGLKNLYMEKTFIFFQFANSQVFDISFRSKFTTFQEAVHPVEEDPMLSDFSIPISLR